MRYKGLRLIVAFRPVAELVRLKSGKVIAESMDGTETSFHEFMLVA